MEPTRADKKQCLELLNVLGPQYYGSSGLEKKGRYCVGGYAYMLQRLIDSGHAVVHDNKQLVYHLTSENEESDDMVIRYDIDYLKQLSQTIIPFKTVIIKYTVDDWYGTLHEWYNKSCKPSHKSCLPLPTLRTRKYIKIIEPFMKISISSEIKGSPLTIDDLLFATRGLMVDEDRKIGGGYELLKYHGGVLEIEPVIDNFST